MKKIIKFLKSIVSLSIVMFGSYLQSFYITNEISFTSVFVGIIGLLILFPAILRWDQALWGKGKSDANKN